MKKTLIALAVAASAAVSGSAMAWTQNGTGGSVDLGGTLTPVEKVTPWEVKVGAAVNDLDAQIQKGQKEVSIAVNKAIPVLGIRNASTNGFEGRQGIKPQIDYNGAIDLDGFSKGVTTLTLKVTDADGNKSGTLSAPFSSAGASSWSGGGSVSGSKTLYSSASGDSFYGGLAKNRNQALLAGAVELIGALSSDFVGKWVVQGTKWYDGTETFADQGINYYGVYGSGIEQGKTIKITLDKAASGDDSIQWKASLPVTVSYQ
ncbi:TPA: hypothetical protein JWL09_005276 [Escherichia coli]|nr:hypothetical protein [Escherichia coli]